jgi:hypothetical protein
LELLTAMRNQVPTTIEEKLRLIADLDERIARSRSAERQALMRGAVIGIAMFAGLGAIPHYMDPFLFDLFRYACCAALLGGEFLIRRAGRRRLEVTQEALMERPMVESRS